jgi:hypothetical protein
VVDVLGEKGSHDFPELNRKQKTENRLRHESKAFSEEDLYQVQDHSPQGSSAGDLREPQT